MKKSFLILALPFILAACCQPCKEEAKSDIIGQQNVKLESDIMTPEVSTIHHEPYYLYAINTQRFIFVVPVVFLVATLERAIDSFDAEATKRDIVPFKE